MAVLTTESSLYSNVRALLKEANSPMSSFKGKLRWNLQKKLKSDPSCSVLLIQVLVKELETCHKAGQRMNPETDTDKECKRRSCTHIIPALHTLYYVILQSSAIPVGLYQSVYECLMKLLILPLPYSAVALSTLRSIKMEIITPGSLYLRRVISEQNLKNEQFSLKEKVFVLADPAVFSVQLEATVRKHLEVSSFLRNTSTLERNVVQHVLQTGLGVTCQSSKVAQALEALGDHMVEKYFQEVVLIVEESVKHGTAHYANYLTSLHNIHSDILTSFKEDRAMVHPDSVCSTGMPSPEIHFVLWRDEEDLWDLLSNTASGTDERKDEQDSVQSSNSGIVGDLQECNFDVKEQPPVGNSKSAFNRRNAFKNAKPADRLSLVKEKVEVFPGSSPVLGKERRYHTARVVVMGDDRVLGRLTRAYHAIRERESKHLILTRKLNLQLYYIPVTSLSPPKSPCQDDGSLALASLLGRVDPWYNSNISSLQATIQMLAGKISDPSKPLTQDHFLLDSLCYYLRCGLQPVNLPLYSVKMTRSGCHLSSVVEDVFVSQLEADIPEFRHLKESSAKLSSSRGKKRAERVFGAIMSVTYTKMSLSKRVVKGEAPMTCGLVVTSEPAAVTSGEDYLSVRFNCLNPECNTMIQTQNISVRTLECRTLSVRLDKDSRRTYTDVQRMEITRCLDPAYSLGSRFSVSTEQMPLLSKYLDTVLSLPINTFSGVTP